MNKSTRRIKGLAEVSIRVKDLDAMHKFYEEVVGLEVLRRDESFMFFKVAEGYGGHTQNLALFDATNRVFLESKSEQLTPAQTTLHHIALNIALEDCESEKNTTRGLGAKSKCNRTRMVACSLALFPRPRGQFTGVCFL